MSTRSSLEKSSISCTAAGQPVLASIWKGADAMVSPMPSPRQSLWVVNRLRIRKALEIKFKLWKASSPSRTRAMRQAFWVRDQLVWYSMPSVIRRRPPWR